MQLLQRTCEVPLNTGARVTADVMNVSFSDRDGITLLRHLMERQVEFLNLSPFIAGEIEIRRRAAREDNFLNQDYQQTLAASCDTDLIARAQRGDDRPSNQFSMRTRNASIACVCA